MLNDYAKFVDTTTSEASRKTMALANRILDIRGEYSYQPEQDEVVEEVQVARLLTAVIGMMAESGEFAEVVKKKVFQADSHFQKVKSFI